MTNGSITENKALGINGNKANGGGIYARNFEIRNSEISGNEASYSGGGIYLQNYRASSTSQEKYTSILSDKSLLSGNKANQNGGGISSRGVSSSYLTDNAIVKITDSFILDNGFNAGGLVTQNGGGIYILGSNTVPDKEYIKIDNSKIDGNKAKNGGALYLHSGMGTIEGFSQINNNQADGTGGGIYAGGTLSAYVLLQIKGAATINNNNAKSNGGGIYLNKINSILNIIDHIGIADNSAAAGGGIWISVLSNLYANKLIFDSNEAEKGYTWTLNTATVKPILTQ